MGATKKYTIMFVSSNCESLHQRKKSLTVAKQIVVASSWCEKSLF